MTRMRPSMGGEGMAKHLELTPRLRLLADRVHPGAKLADVGTDHAYLPVWLWPVTGVWHLYYAIASDLREGPLERAKLTGRTYGASHIDYRLCAGLDDIRPQEVDTIVVAGMGGETIASILEAAPWTADGAHTLLLQPMTHAELLRSFLCDHGYAITWEALVRDRGTIYPVMEVSRGTMSLSQGQLWGGVMLLHDSWGTVTSSRRSSGCKALWQDWPGPACPMIKRRPTDCGISSPLCCP